MPSAWIRSAPICLLALVVAGPADAGQESDRSAVVEALEKLITTGEPRHTNHDEGQRLQLAVDAAVANGDMEIERLAIRAAAPLTVSVSKPVSSTRDIPALTFNASEVLHVRRPVAYRARMFASIDGGEFTSVGAVESGKGSGGRIDRLLPELSARPGFHVVRIRAELQFGAEGAARSWAESRTLAPVYYVIYDPESDSSASVRALIYRPASTPARDFDTQLGDEPFATWLSGTLSARRAAGDIAPEWFSQYCDERISEAGHLIPPTAICSVVGFQSRGEIVQMWFRTADIREAERGPEWVPLTPPQFEGIVFRSGPASQALSALPALLDTPEESRPAGDLSILPDQIVYTPASSSPTAPGDVIVTVRNIGQQDLHKALVIVAWGVDTNARPAMRQFVVDIPAQQLAELKLQVAFPNGYGFVMVQASPISEHSPAGAWNPDPTPDDNCAVRVVNAQLAPPRYRDTLLQTAGPGCIAK